MSDILVGYFTVAKQPVNQIQIHSHGLLNGDTVRFSLGAVGNTLPAPLTVDTWYYVVGAAADTFQVASTTGGTAIVLTNEGTGSNEAWSPAPTEEVWVYELLVTQLRAPEYMPDIAEVNYYAQRGWELYHMGQGTLEGGPVLVYDAEDGTTGTYDEGNPKDCGEDCIEKEEKAWLTDR